MTLAVSREVQALAAGSEAQASTPLPRTVAAPIAPRSADASPTKPAAERPARPIPAPLLANPSPFARSQASAPAGRAEWPPSEIDSFADTLTDSPDVQMPDLPVLTDAVEPRLASSGSRARAEMAYARPDPSAPAARIAVVPPSAAATPSSRAAPPAPVASAPQSRSLRLHRNPRPRRRTVPVISEEDLLHQTQTVRALAAAKSIDDISNSMAETLFGESDLDMLSAALASSGWSETSGAETDTASVPEKRSRLRSRKRERRGRAFDEEQDPFDFLGLGRDAPLELIDDAPPSNDGKRKTASTR